MKAIIVYEVYNREYDNCLLLKAALERQECNVQIVYKMDLVSQTYSEEKTLIFIPNCYNSEDFKYYYYCANRANALFINLQYEQVLSGDKLNLDYHMPKGKATEIINICWGKAFANFLRGRGIDVNNIVVCGAMQLDFLRKEFESFWINKKDIAEKYQLPLNLRWVLFISSFSFANNPLVNKASDSELGKNNNLDFRNLSIESRNVILKWFDRYLESNTDAVIIYRKHPMEVYDKSFSSISEKYPDRFLKISDYNIKQWIMISDSICNWYSTSGVECVAANKPFDILRPYPMPPEKEVTLYRGAHFIESYDEFVRSLQSKQKDFPFDVTRVYNDYKIDEIPAYRKIVDFSMAYYGRSESASYWDKDFLFNRKKYVVKHKIKIKYNLKKFYQLLYRRGFKINSKKIRRKYFVDDWEFQALLIDDRDKYRKIKSII